jgi:hypothetical protein
MYESPQAGSRRHRTRSRQPRATSRRAARPTGPSRRPPVGQLDIGSGGDSASLIRPDHGEPRPLALEHDAVGAGVVPHGSVDDRGRTGHLGSPGRFRPHAPVASVALTRSLWREVAGRRVAEHFDAAEVWDETLAPRLHGPQGSTSTQHPPSPSRSRRAAHLVPRGEAGSRY